MRPTTFQKNFQRRPLRFMANKKLLQRVHGAHSAHTVRAQREYSVLTAFMAFKGF